MKRPGIAGLRCIRRAVFGSVLLGGCMVGCASEAEYIRSGDELLDQGDHEEALQYYFQALEENPDSTQAHLGVGMVYMLTDRLDEAEKAIERARRIEETERVLLTLATLRHQQKRYVDAAALIKKALEDKPDDAELHFRLGVIQKDAGDTQNAVESFQHCVSLDPEMLEAHAELAEGLKRLKRYQEAVDVLTEARRRFKGKDIAKIHATLGEVYEAMGMADYAEHAYRQALKRAPKNVVALAGLGRSLRVGGKLPESIETLTVATRDNDKNAALFTELGISYKDYRLKPQAIEALKKAVELDPKRPEPYPHLLALLEGDKAAEAAMFETLGNASTALPDELDIQIRYGSAAYERKKYAEAVGAMQRAIVIEPANVEANFTLGMAQLYLGNRDGAVASFEALKYLDAEKAQALAEAIDSGVAEAAAPEQPTKGKRKRKRKSKSKRRRR